jgi:hypothetical protein
MTGLSELLTKLRRGFARKDAPIEQEIVVAEMENARRDRKKRVELGLKEMQKSADALGSLVRDMQAVRSNGRG